MAAPQFRSVAAPSFSGVSSTLDTAGDLFKSAFGSLEKAATTVQTGREAVKTKAEDDAVADFTNTLAQARTPEEVAAFDLSGVNALPVGRQAEVFAARDAADSRTKASKTSQDIFAQQQSTLGQRNTNAAAVLEATGAQQAFAKDTRADRQRVTTAALRGEIENIPYKQRAELAKNKRAAVVSESAEGRTLTDLARNGQISDAEYAVQIGELDKQVLSQSFNADLEDTREASKNANGQLDLNKLMTGMQGLGHPVSSIINILKAEDSLINRPSVKAKAAREELWANIDRVTKVVQDATKADEAEGAEANAFIVPYMLKNPNITVDDILDQTLGKDSLGQIIGSGNRVFSDNFLDPSLLDQDDLEKALSALAAK